MNLRLNARSLAAGVIMAALTTACGSDDPAKPRDPTVGNPPSMVPPEFPVDVASSSVVDALNAQFNTQQPYTSMAAAGVLLHEWDGTGQADKPWIPGGGQGHSAASSSSSIINNRVRTTAPKGYAAPDGMISVYTQDFGKPPELGGVIYNTSLTNPSVTALCMYSSDAGTDNRLDGGCGCPDWTAVDVCKDYNAGTATCAQSKDCAVNCLNCDNSCGSAPDPGLQCAFNNAQVEGMMNACVTGCESNIQFGSTAPCYNEVMVDASSWSVDEGSVFPQVIWAFFYVKGSASDVPDWKADTITAWKKFIVDYAGKTPLPPLVELDVRAVKSKQSPYDSLPFTLLCETPDDKSEVCQNALNPPSDDL